MAPGDGRGGDLSPSALVGIKRRKRKEESRGGSYKRGGTAGAGMGAKGGGRTMPRAAGRAARVRLEAPTEAGSSGNAWPEEAGGEAASRLGLRRVALFTAEVPGGAAYHRKEGRGFCVTVGGK